MSNDELEVVLAAIETRRYPAKNAALVQVSFKLGPRAQEMALLRLREVCQIGPEHARGYALKDTLVLPKSFTKGARATARRPRSGSNERESARTPRSDQPSAR